MDAFRIDVTEVTVKAYAECVKAGACSPRSCTSKKAGQEHHPVNCVDWSQAAAFCKWAGKRLPTDKEWEKAARGTDGRKYPWGNGGYGTWMLASITGEDDGFAETAPVGSFPDAASPYGAQDMMGNVWEWTADRRGGGRSVRGGSWWNPRRFARASHLNQEHALTSYRTIGFRCAQSH